jgi:hypothetical protein
MRLQGLLIFTIALFAATPGLSPAKEKKDKDAGAAASAPVSNLTDAEREAFLKNAKIIRTKAASKGVTGTTRVTMTDGKITHDAHVQCIDESKHEFVTDRGTELNFKDSYKFNIAAYRLARLLELTNLPVTVERKVTGKTCAVDWWVDDVMMDEAGRKQKKLDAPDINAWNHQMYVVRVFDQLIYNVDRNLTNLLILKDWNLVMIDHSRSFRLAHSLENPKNLVMCDRTLLKNLRALDPDTVQKRLMPYCTKSEVESVMVRRDIIVRFFDDQVKEKGEASVLYDLQSGSLAKTANP